MQIEIPNDYVIGDIIEFQHYNTRRVGEIADISDDDKTYFIRIKSGEIFKVNKEDIKDIC